MNGDGFFKPIDTEKQTENKGARDLGINPLALCRESSFRFYF